MKRFFIKLNVFVLWFIAVSTWCVFSDEANSSIFSITETFQTSRRATDNHGWLGKPVEINKEPVIHNSLSAYTPGALHDFRQTIRQQFVEIVGSAKNKMTREQFDELLNKGQGPCPGNRGEDYLSIHDIDRDNLLTLTEFTPSIKELSEFYQPETITNAYVFGKSYPNMASPIGNPAVPEELSNHSRSRLFLTIPELEARLQKFAEIIGGSTFRDEKGHIKVRDATGNLIVPSPPVVPLAQDIAAKRLQEFARRIGGKIINNSEGKLSIIAPDGKELPFQKWPLALRPPFLPPNFEH